MCILYNAGQGQITGNSWCSWSSDLETGVPPVRRVTDHVTDVRLRTRLGKCGSRNQCLAPHVSVPVTGTGAGAGAWVPGMHHSNSFFEKSRR